MIFSDFLVHFGVIGNRPDFNELHQFVKKCIKKVSKNDPFLTPFFTSHFLCFGFLTAIDADFLEYCSDPKSMVLETPNHVQKSAKMTVPLKLDRVDNDFYAFLKTWKNLKFLVKIWNFPKSQKSRFLVIFYEFMKITHIWL